MTQDGSASSWWPHQGRLPRRGHHGPGHRDQGQGRAKRRPATSSRGHQKCAADHVAEHRIVISLPNDDMKGRIIGREGRNIGPWKPPPAWTSSSTTPQAVIVSAFDPVRRRSPAWRWKSSSWTAASRPSRKWWKRPARKWTIRSGGREQAVFETHQHGITTSW